MLLALSVCLWAVVIAGAPGAAPGARTARSYERRPRARASARSTSTRGAAPSSTATASRSPSPWTPRASTPCRRTSTTRRAPRPALARALGPRRRRRARSCRRSSRRAAPSSGCGARWTPPPRGRCATCSSRASASSPRTAATTRSASWPRRCSATSGVDNTGMSGIEYAFEDADPRPRGQGRRPHRRPPPRRSATPRSPPPTGTPSCSPSTRRIQHVAERELERAVPETGSIAGVAVVMDPRTGEILALANRPDLQPEPLRRLPELRAGATARWPTPTSRAASSRSSPPPPRLQEKVVDPDEVHRLRPRLRSRSRAPRINDHHVFDQLTLPRRDREVERRRRDPRGPAPGPRELQPLHARLRLRRAPPASTCPASRRACCGRPRAGARSRWPRSRSARRSA